MNGSQTSTPTVRVYNIPYVGMGFFNENAAASIISWLKYTRLGMGPDYFMEHQTFVLYNMSHINFKRVGVDQEDPTGQQERTSRSLL